MSIVFGTLVCVLYAFNWVISFAIKIIATISVIEMLFLIGALIIYLIGRNR